MSFLGYLPYRKPELTKALRATTENTKKNPIIMKQDYEPKPKVVNKYYINVLK